LFDATLRITVNRNSLGRRALRQTKFVSGPTAPQKRSVNKTFIAIWHDFIASDPAATASSMQIATTHLTTEYDGSSRTVLRGFLAAFFVCVFLRFALSANLLDKVVNYSADGGIIVEKIHPSSYGIVFVLIGVLLTTRIELGAWELRALRGLIQFAAVIVMLAAMMLVLGHTGSLGYLVDSYLIACASGALLLFFPQPWRYMLATSLLIFIIAGAVVALGEFASRTRLLPYPLEELSFRPTGLSEHPLVLGLFNAIGICFVAASNWKPAIKTVAIVVLLLGAFAAGARVASIVASLSALAVIAFHKWPSAQPLTRVRMKTLIFIASALAVPAAFGLLLQAGLLDRFQGGLFDQSALARVNIYGLFDLVTWNEILFGADIGYIRQLALEHFDLEYIESSLVMFVFEFGLLGTIVFLLMMARTFQVLLSGASRFVVIGTVAFFVIAGGNNSLTTKSSIVLMIILLVIGFHATPEPALRVNNRR
jgi:hypothetical protein